ncbi:MAG: hypothetical protein KatS3mg099_131 [Candidatus Parcubacteria bacterium]|nr:MAG: hypothetical protein KatS3mg099_131 [Candidatus Parcubacteria bacterium]
MRERLSADPESVATSFFKRASEEQTKAVFVGLMVQVPLASVKAATSPSTLIHAWSLYCGEVVPMPRLPVAKRGS